MIRLDLRESYKQKDLYVTFLADIDPSPEVNLARIPRKQRRMVRQGEKHGLKFSHDDRRLRDFYDIYAASVRNLGTPVYPYDYFQRLADSFGAQCKIFLVDFDNKTIAAVMSFFFKDQVMPYYGGALREYCRMAPSDFMYWELLAYGATHGCCVFDFGRSKLGTGSFDFKRHWGFEPRPLPYWYRSLNGHEIPDTSPLNPKLQWAIRIWRKLPLGVTKEPGTPYRAPYSVSEHFEARGLLVKRLKLAIVAMKILFLAQRTPYPPNKGEKIRFYHILAQLAKKHTVSLAYWVDDPKDIQHVNLLRTVCKGGRVRPGLPQLD